VLHSGRKYTVLPLAPGPDPPSTNADLILPQPTAFQDPRSHIPAGYPQFTSQTSNWPTVLRLITQPMEVWECWAPMTLGTYKSVHEIWHAWDHGAAVESVGSAPPLRLLTRYQVWRPSSAQVRASAFSLLVTGRLTDLSQARKQWSLFEFFMKHVQAVIDTGSTAFDAVDTLDSERGDRSMPTFHTDLQ
ncbi:uncharacterized protein PHACADRAFT_55780, partial [Phanerochaete carnosa HHB-10118-sp]